MRVIGILAAFSAAAVIALSGCGGDSDSNNENSSSSSLVSSVSENEGSLSSMVSSASESESASSIESVSSASGSSVGDANLSGSLITEPSRGVVDDTALVRANAALNRDIFLGMDKANENLFYSSFSIFSALSMTYAGAANDTKSQFEQVMHYDANLSVHESFAALLKKSTYEYNTFNIANSLWPQESYPFKEDFIYTVYKGYDSETYVMDYINNYENARLMINDWVEEKTEDKIVDLIPEGALSVDTRLVLVNALYFKGTWEYSFDANDTDKQPFHLNDGSQKEADMMHMEADVLYYENSMFQAVELPYKENEFSMLIFLPKTIADMTALKTALFDTGSTETFRAQMQTANSVVISIPKFKIKWGTKSLKTLLINLGMADAFDPYLADFTGIWYREPGQNLYISDVLHQAFIEVNEEGAEAAAATAVIVSDLASDTGPEPITFNADHPFIFFIVDNKTGMTLFSGKVEAPVQ